MISLNQSKDKQTLIAKKSPILGIFEAFIANIFLTLLFVFLTLRGGKFAPFC